MEQPPSTTPAEGPTLATTAPVAAVGVPSPEFLAAIPRDFARRHLVLSGGRDSNLETLRCSAATPPWITGNVAVMLDMPVRTIIDDPERIAADADRAYASGHRDQEQGEAPTLDGAEADAARALKEMDHDLLSVGDKGPIILLVDAILFEALTRGASDVHVQPLADRTLVRYRVDGVLFDVRELAASLAGAVISRIKVMGRMDVAERGAPQDGRATVTIGTPRSGGDSKQGGAGGGSGSRSIDLRISTLPTAYGERAVIRLLDTARGQRLTDLSILGMPDHVRTPYLDRVNRAHGIVLVTGPTGSGKTTTLYSTLRLVAEPAAGKLSGEHNIMTIEDPIEYELSTVGLAVSQTQTNPKKGLTFANGLRHILRQDPDVVMVGEIRDAETARMALQASLTGHMVLSTLHTNDAVTAVTRLVDLGIEPYLVGASLSAVLAQRLVRTIHKPCNGAGCEACLMSGFSGRMGVFELLVVNDAIREGINAAAGETKLRDMARANGMRSLSEEAKRLAQERLTTLAEVRRVIQGLE